MAFFALFISFCRISVAEVDIVICPCVVIDLFTFFSTIDKIKYQSDDGVCTGYFIRVYVVLIVNIDHVNVFRICLGVFLLQAVRIGVHGRNSLIEICIYLLFVLSYSDVPDSVVSSIVIESLVLRKVVIGKTIT